MDAKQIFQHTGMMLIGFIGGFEVAPRTVLFLLESDPYLYTLICEALPHFSGLR